ncbi:RNA-binding cell elongation regulator Jag/EloR [Alkalibacterium thalassium]|uniref:RNA-binding protein KhpB n=1 Tax=Alkalibacterium thalassium TaxID=426701 RepID=A0A1G9AIR1_9LACT|nr:RNA-binding cell elongation regulator Jag/EloR [Alkalibacterium thalassium]SDK27161.1 spoIIIJ-associated protein [Alkalibacterium thalassium]
MKDKYTAQAPTTEEAIDKGLKALGIKRDNADITISQESKKGFLGIGQKDAVVVVKRKNAKNPVEDLVSKEILLGEKEPSTNEPEIKEAAEPDDKVSSLEESTDPVEEGVEETDTTHPVRADDEEKVEGTTKKSEPEEKKIIELNEKDEAAIQNVADYIKRIADKMGIDDVSVTINRTDRRVQYIIDTEDAGLIIGRHGKVLNSLQTLAQIQLHQEADNKLFAKVDAENYRDRRQKTVEQLAYRTAEKVKKTKRPVILEPMPAHERKQIHRYLNQHKGVQTHSEGKEPHRYLVVEPSKDNQFKI